MKALFSLVVGFALGMPFAGAEILSGNLQLFSQLEVHIRPEPNCGPGDPRPGCNPPFDINMAPGYYPANTDVNVDSMFFTITARPRPARFAIILPPNKSMPYEGNFSLGPMETGQNWGLEGVVSTSESDSPEQSAWENCTQGGRRWVSFHDHYISHVLNMDIVEGRVVGRFNGQSSRSERVYSQMGPCQW